MLLGLYIFLDDDLDDPVYADPKPDDLEAEGAWGVVAQVVQDAFDEEVDPEGVTSRSDFRVGWRHVPKHGLTFVVVVTTAVRGAAVDQYLTNLVRRYLDEVDDVRNPERGGVEDVVVDVIPPWEDED